MLHAPLPGRLGSSNRTRRYLLPVAATRVLVVEDEPAFAQLAREYLEGFDVTVAYSGLAGLQALASELPDVLLLDLMLPDMRGLVTLQRFRSVDPDLPIVILTSVENEAFSLAALRGGAQDYLVKGEVGPQALRRSLRLAMERPRAPGSATLNAAMRHLEILEAEQTMLRQVLRTPTHDTGGAAQWAPGALVARRYKLESALGTSGQARVFLARDMTLERPVVLKTLPTGEESPRGFLKEARLLAALDHPNIVRILDFGMEGAQPYLVLEQIVGEDAQMHVGAHGPLPPAEATRVGIGILDALEHAHSHGVLHRDVKPSNVMLARDGSTKLLDFGIGTLEPQAPATHASPAFASPEALEGRPLSPASDQYGVATTIVFLLTGAPPRADAKALEGASPALARVLERAMQPAPDARYESVARMRDALAAALTTGDKGEASGPRR